MKPYDQQNALVQLAKQCNKECSAAIKGKKPREFTSITLPIFSKYSSQAKNIGCTLVQLKYQIAVINHQITDRR